MKTSSAIASVFDSNIARQDAVERVENSYHARKATVDRNPDTTEAVNFIYANDERLRHSLSNQRI